MDEVERMIRFARDAEQKAEAASDPYLKFGFRELAEQWRERARGLSSRSASSKSGLRR